jgi:hypothetical protein
MHSLTCVHCKRESRHGRGAGRAASADRLTVSQTSDLSARSTQHQAGAFNEINNDKRACVYRLNSTCLVSRAGSNGRRNTIQCVDSAMLPWEDHLFGFTWTKPSQGSVPAALTLASEFGFCFQCQAGSSLVLRRPIETTGFIRHKDFSDTRI